MHNSFAFIVVLISLVAVESFVPFHHHEFRLASGVSLAAGKKRQRRKQPPDRTPANPTAKIEVAPTPPVAKKQSVAAPVAKEVVEKDVVEEETVDAKVMIADIANFKFEPDNAITKGIKDEQSSTAENTVDPLVLPDIKDMLKKKERERELEKMDEEMKADVKKIKRSDKEAFTKLLEQDPYADMDDSFFEQEEYGTVSALLGERAKSFLGIPPGPLQVAHFIGALVIILMAFVEYPGFPLTNLPSPVRACFQGGLGTVYAINTVLAVLATFKAGERGQSKILWGVKTFSVGGLAYDQLTQLPTLEQVEEAKSRKGRRALKKR